MEFLYKYGYDYASMHVHPMANDGQQDFYSITKLEPAPRFPPNITVLSNSILASSMILQDAMNHSSFKWRKLIWTYLEQVRELLDTGNLTYQQSFFELGRVLQTEALCEPTQA